MTPVTITSLLARAAPYRDGRSLLDLTFSPCHALNFAQADVVMWGARTTGLSNRLINLRNVLEIVAAATCIRFSTAKHPFKCRPDKARLRARKLRGCFPSWQAHRFLRKTHYCQQY